MKRGLVDRTQRRRCWALVRVRAGTTRRSLTVLHTHPVAARAPLQASGTFAVLGLPDIHAEPDVDGVPFIRQMKRFALGPIPIGHKSGRSRI